MTIARLAIGRKVGCTKNSLPPAYLVQWEGIVLLFHRSVSVNGEDRTGVPLPYPLQTGQGYLSPPRPSPPGKAMQRAVCLL